MIWSSEEIGGMCEGCGYCVSMHGVGWMFVETC